MMKRILITGGTGSFGSAAVKRLLTEPSVERIVVFSRDEKKQHDMRHAISDARVDYVVGDIRERDSIEDAVKDIDTVFHAAALKQVPTGEFYPMEMLKTNVLGTQNVIEAAENCPSVEKVVFLSTDKAVLPINVLGITKAMAEKLFMSRARKRTKPIFCSVRYGNVMGSRGSVIPLFLDQIKHNKPITVTDPRMTRFMLSLDDAIELVLLAIKKGEQGDLFIRKAPAATIGDLAQSLVDLFGSKAGIQEIGVRAGEKLHETLATALELARAEDLGDYYRIRNIAEYDYRQFYEKGVIKQVAEDFTSENAQRLTLEETKQMLTSLSLVQETLPDSP